MGRITTDQSHQVMATLAVNTNWEDIDFSASGLQDLVVRDPKEAGRRFTDFLKNGCQATVNISSFPIWKTITIGGVSKNELLQQLAEKKFYISDWAKDIMSKPEFTTLPEKKPINLARIKVRDLGFSTQPTTVELWARIKQVGSLCPAEVGPHLRLELADQAKGDYFWLAMNTITDSDGYPNVFKVKHDDYGKFWLHGNYANPGPHWNLENELVFVLASSTLLSESKS